MSHQTSLNSQSTVKLNVTQKPVCKGGDNFNLKLITAVVFACACLVQGVSNIYAKGSSNSTSVLESNSLVHQQSLQASETEDDSEDTCSWYSRCPVPGGGSMS
jgi:hypothetical protein